MRMRYDIIIVGAGPGGIFASYELVKKNPEIKADRKSTRLNSSHPSSSRMPSSA